MSFNSLQFLIFFPITVVVFFLIPHRFRWVWLLAASYFFYMCWKPVYALLILLTTGVDYVAGLRMGATQRPRVRRIWLILSLASNLGMLFGFKYLNFASASVSSLFTVLGFDAGLPRFNVLLPLGISFYTFQSMSYAIDVYRGARPPEKHFGYFALYVVFFPQLVAGPIERSTHLLPMLRERQTFEFTRMLNGLALMLWGFFKKVVVADRLAIYVDAVYSNPGAHHGAPIALATYLFAFQILCDFSGYTDIAIGAAQVFGYSILDNFNRPYAAVSVREFWHRWHITLSTWFREYLYIPLGGNRVGAARRRFNLLVVFVLAGVWHGANWTFFTWGCLHAVYMIAGVAISDRWGPRLAAFAARWPRTTRVAGALLTFHLVCFAWVFFRADSMQSAFVLLLNLFPSHSWGEVARVALGPTGLVVAIGSIVFMECVHFAVKHEGMRRLIASGPAWRRWALVYALAALILVFGVSGARPFVYFRF